MFSDVAHFSQLFHSVWPSMDVIQVTASGGADTFSAGGSSSVTDNAVMTTGSWNYGVDFGGPTKSSWTSGADTVHGGATEGMFGSFGVVDSAYSGTSTVGSIIGLCPGTAGSICRG